MGAMKWLGTAALGIAGLSGLEFYRNQQIKPLPARPVASDRTEGFDKIMKSNIHELIGKLDRSEPLSEEDYDTIEHTCQYLDARYDCSDFRMQTMIRLLYLYSDQIRDEVVMRMRGSLLDSKFFMDQPGEDSLCLWSENHLLLFAAAEYLTGQLYTEEVFSNDGLTGKDHMEIAKERILIWLDQRFRFGFIEWYSNTYYEEDIAPLSNLIDFCHDETMVDQAKMVMDLLLFDLASQSHQGSFTSTSGRQYEAGKKSGHNSALINVSNKIWGYTYKVEKKGLDQNFIYIKNYEVPAVIKRIGEDLEPRIIKASSGLNVDEMVELYPNGQALDRIMMQWAMESFTNEEVITDTMHYIHRNKMLSNEFLNDFKLIDLAALKYSGALPLISRTLRPMTNGVAIQRANTYTYRTRDFMLATAQNYHPGGFGDQQHIWSATLPDGVCVCTTHPARPFTDDGALSASPGYWVGNGRNPHGAQDEAVNLCIYDIEKRKGLLEKDLVFETHAYFPAKEMDELVVLDRQLIARKGQAFISLRGKNKLRYKDGLQEDLVQKGQLTYWITELSSSTDESFDVFMDRVKKQEVLFDAGSKTLNYYGKKRFSLTYQGTFSVDGDVVDTDYNRFDSSYSQTERMPETITISHSGEWLELDMNRGMRKVTHG